MWRLRSRGPTRANEIAERIGETEIQFETRSQIDALSYASGAEEGKVRLEMALERATQTGPRDRGRSHLGLAQLGLAAPAKPTRNSTAAWRLRSPTAESTIRRCDGVTCTSFGRARLSTGPIGPRPPKRQRSCCTTRALYRSAISSLVVSGLLSARRGDRGSWELLDRCSSPCAGGKASFTPSPRWPRREPRQRGWRGGSRRSYGRRTRRLTSPCAKARGVKSASWRAGGGAPTCATQRPLVGWALMLPRLPATGSRRRGSGPSSAARMTRRWRSGMGTMTTRSCARW